MTKRILTVLAMFVVLFGAVACVDNASTPMVEGSRQIAVKADSKSAYDTKTIAGNSWAVPQGMDLDKFPVLGRKLTEDDVIRLDLRLDKLKEDTILFNENRARHSFPAEIVKAGSKVWVDGNGAVRYKKDCGNRAEVPADIFTCPTSVVCPGPHVVTGNDPNGKNLAVTPDTTKKTVGNWQMPDILGGILLALGLLVWLALLLATLVLILWALWRLIQWLADDIRRRRTPPVRLPTPPVAPLVVVPPVVVPPVAPVVPVSTTTTHKYGPFRAVRIEDLGTRGYRAYGDSTPIGDFTSLIDIKDAGLAGQYVVVTTTT